MTSQILKAIADQLNRQGFVHLKRIFPPDLVHRVQNFVPEYVARKYGPGYRPVHTDNPAAGCEVEVAENYFVPFARSLKLSGVLDAILGPTSFLRMPVSCRAVYPNHPEALGPAHQDGGRLHDMEQFITAWIPLVNIDQECGGLGLYLSLGLPNAAIPEGEHGINMGAIAPKPIYMSPGDVLIFHKWLPHVSMPNTSDRVRYSLDMRIYSSLVGEQKKEAIDLQRWVWITPPKK